MEIIGGNFKRIKSFKRLIAEDGKILRNTETGVTAYCVDVLEEKVEKWEEIEDTELTDRDIDDNSVIVDVKEI